MSWRGMLGVRTLLWVGVLLVVLLVAAPAWADGPVGSDPAQNFPLGAMPAACASQPDGAWTAGAASGCSGVAGVSHSPSSAR